MLPLRSARLSLQPKTTSFLISRSALRAFPFRLQRHVSKSSTAQDPTKRQTVDEQLEVKHFEQDDSPNPKRRRVDDGDEQDDLASLKARIAQLEQEIQSFKLPHQASESIVGKLFSTQQRQQSTVNFEDDLAELDVWGHQIKSIQPLTRTGQIYVDKLNECLDTASLNPEDEQTRKALWKWYERSKSNISQLRAIIPKPGWELLWNTQSVNGPSNPDRASHLAILAEDMLEAGLELSEQQRSLQVEAYYLTGQVAKALHIWETHGAGEQIRTAEYLEMGVRMYANQGDVKKAEELLNILFKSSIPWDPRIILSAIAACSQTKTKADAARAWALYLRMRQLLATGMTMDDYDTVTLNFLRANARDLALAVFRDMMLSGDAIAASASTSLYKKALTRMGQFFSLSKDAAEVNSVSLDALTYLPRRYQNKFFYASWLKRLIGMGHLDGAAQVIELMYERGVRPDAKHVNGLISAWLRDGSSPARRQAEALAWSMIQRRIDFVHARRTRKDLSAHRKKASVYISRPDLVLPAFLERPVPFATSETFSIMAGYYLRQEMFENVRHLRDMLVDCEIPMSSYFMNHLLYAELRNRGYRQVWARFEVMTRTVKPDIETFICLWECMKFHVDKARNTDRNGFPTPLQLFAVMMRWFSGLHGQERSDAVGDLDIDTYHDIVRCFCLIGSFEGAFVAMHAVKDCFSLLPTMKTTRMLIMQMARMNVPKFRRPSTAKSHRSKELGEQSLAKVTEVLDILTRQRRVRMEEQGVDFHTLSAAEQSDELHRTLLVLIYTMASRQSGSEATDKAIEAMAAQLCVKPFSPEEAIALIV